MFPYTFEAVTAITIIVLSVIIALYIVVLKRKGWLKEETSPESFFLCPNPECKKNLDVTSYRSAVRDFVKLFPHYKPQMGIVVYLERNWQRLK